MVKKYVGGSVGGKAIVQDYSSGTVKKYVGGKKHIFEGNTVVQKYFEGNTVVQGQKSYSSGYF
jgi:hypothetical protein